MKGEEKEMIAKNIRKDLLDSWKKEVEGYISAKNNCDGSEDSQVHVIGVHGRMQMMFTVFEILDDTDLLIEAKRIDRDLTGI